MKTWAAALLLIITIVNVFATDSIESLSNVHSIEMNVSAATNDSHFSTSIIANQDTNSGCNDGREASHACHLGHCGILIIGANSIIYPSFKSTVNFPSDSRLKSATLQSKKKPPKYQYI